MITEDYVSFEIAKLLKEKGFDNKCSGYYNQERVLQRLSTCSIKDTLRSPFYFDCMPAPTLQMAMKWLREVHNLYIQFVLNQDVQGENTVIENYYHFNVSCLDRFANEGSDCKFYNSYEQAADAAIKYCLENLI